MTSVTDPVQMTQNALNEATSPRSSIMSLGDLLLTTEQVAAMTGFSIKSLEMRRYRDKGGPPSRRIGRSVRYRLSDVSAWLRGLS